MTNLVQFPGLGLSFELNRVAFSIGGFSIYWYGVCIAFGICLALVFAFRHSIEFGVDPDSMVDVILIGIVLGIVSARAYYVAMAPFKYENIWEMIAVRDGGLAIYGGIIGGAITVLVLSRVKKIPPLVMLDNASMGVIIGQICGRWGNFMNREAHGSVTDSFFKMGLADAAGNITYYHPTFLYESVWNLVGFIGLHFYCKKRKFDGEVFLLYVAWYGLGRAWIEGLRTDSLYLFSTGIRVSQLVAAVSFVAAAGAIAFVLLKKKPKPENLFANRIHESPDTQDEKPDEM